MLLIIMVRLKKVWMWNDCSYKYDKTLIQKHQSRIEKWNEHIGGITEQEGVKSCI